MSTDRYHELKARQRADQLRHPDGMALRVHRALSWLQRAELADDDEDARFLFLWIAFKAAYAEHSLVERDFTESPALRQFLTHLLRLDEGEQLARLLWRQFPQAVRLLLDSPHCFQPYWDAHAQGQIAALSPDEIAALWKPAFERARIQARGALVRLDTEDVLILVLSRLHVPLTQLQLGGTTWDSRSSRDTVRDGARLLGVLVPLIIELMLDNPGADWAAPCYPGENPAF